MKSRYIDITVPVFPGMQTWPGDPRVQFSEGPVARIEFGAHTGTHVDAPKHYLPHGRSVEQLDLNALCGPCEVLDVSGMDCDAMSLALERCHRPRVLLKRAGGSDGATLSPEAAAIVSGKGICLIGTESMSIEALDGDGSIHKSLLEHGIVILETVTLRYVEPGDYDLFALPLPLVGLDGAPCRAVLRTLA